MGETKRRRAMRIDVRNARAATAAVKAVRLSIGRWQQRLVYLNALAERRRSAGESVADMVAEARGIKRQIDQSEAFMNQQARELPAPVSSHSRFQEIVRALATAAQAVDRVATD